MHHSNDILETKFQELRSLTARMLLALRRGQAVDAANLRARRQHCLAELSAARVEFACAA
jgi:hypothetical protein